MELSSGAPCAPQEPNHEGESTSVTSQPLDIQATSKQEDSYSVMSLPLEILHRLLSHCSIPDVLSFAQALGRPELIEVQRLVWISLLRRNDLIFFRS